MQLSSYGYQLAESGDPSRPTTLNANGWFDGYVFNITRLNSHNHDGANSSLISTSSIASITQTISHTTWASPVGGVYSQTVTVPAGITELKNYNPAFIANSGGNAGSRIDLKYVRASATTYTIYCNDNTLDLYVVWR